MLKKAKKPILISLVLIISLALVAIIVLFSYQRAYAGKIYNNVYFGNVNLSGKTKIQAEYLLKSNIAALLNKEIELSVNDKTVNAKLADTGLSFDLNRVAEQGYEIGRAGSFYRNLELSAQTLYKKFNLSVAPKIDNVKYKNFVDIAVAQLNASPQDATLAVQDGNIVFQDSATGLAVKTDTLASAIIGLTGTNENKIKLAAVVAQPKISSANFEVAKQQATDLLNKKYVFTYLNKSYSPTKTQVGVWIEFINSGGQMVAQFNNSNIKAYLNTIAKNFEVSSLVRKINADTGEIIDAGRDGQTLNKDAAVSTLIGQLGSSAVTVAMVTTAIPAKEVKIVPNQGLVLGRFDGKYIDVNLTTQTLCRIEGQNLIDCSTVSTGKPSMSTPTGTFAIMTKNSRAWSTSAGLWMPWFQMFKAGGYGFHELPEWPNGAKEGADHLGVPVSHGCIRLGVGPAETLFNWTDIGTQVYIHK